MLNDLTVIESIEFEWHEWIHLNDKRRLENLN